MNPIGITSTILEHSPQVDGRAWVRERHVTDAGDVDERTYMAEIGADVNALLAEHAAQFLKRLGGGE